MGKTVFGTFQTYDTANAAYNDLISAGYSSMDISVMTRQDTVKNMLDANRDVTPGITDSAATGGVVGGVIGLLIGIGVLAVPGIGSLLIAGPITAALGIGGALATTTSGAITGALAGGLIGAFRELGIDELKAKAIEDKIKRGDILLAVDCTQESDEDEIKDIMRKNNAEEIAVLNLKE